MTAETLVSELSRAPLWRITEAMPAIPAESGFYSWWSALGALPGVPVTPHPSEPFGLLYVGIAPRRADSSATLRSRLRRQHIRGNVGSSTFRLGLAALLWENKGWTPGTSSSGKARLNATDNTALSAWQLDHLRLRWAVTPEPWRLEEEDVIREMRPPMNREHNATHPFYSSMGSARERFRAGARRA